jgi:hypothetical protein
MRMHGRNRPKRPSMRRPRPAIATVHWIRRPGQRSSRSCIDRPKSRF